MYLAFNEWLAMIPEGATYFGLIAVVAFMAGIAKCFSLSYEEKRHEVGVLAGAVLIAVTCIFCFVYWGLVSAVALLTLAFIGRWVFAFVYELNYNLKQYGDPFASILVSQKKLLGPPSRSTQWLGLDIEGNALKLGLPPRNQFVSWTKPYWKAPQQTEFVKQAESKLSMKPYASYDWAIYRDGRLLKDKPAIHQLAYLHIVGVRFSEINLTESVAQLKAAVMYYTKEVAIPRLELSDLDINRLVISDWQAEIINARPVVGLTLSYPLGGEYDRSVLRFILLDERTLLVMTLNYYQIPSNRSYTAITDALEAKILTHWSLTGGDGGSLAGFSEKELASLQALFISDFH